MKSYKYLTFFPAFLFLLMMSSDALAQINGAANTSKEGSLLIWPTVQTDSGNETYITISNNSPNDVFIKCYWQVKDIPSNPTSKGLLADFAIQLSAHSPIVFRASDGSSLDNRGVAAGMGSSEKGSLICWAVDPSVRRQISWNHLSGSAIIVQGDNTLPGSSAPATTSAWQYSAWRFAANVIASNGTFADGFWVGQIMGVSSATMNSLSLKASPTTVVDPSNCTGPNYTASSCSLPNAAYDACPKYMSFEFLSEPSGTSKTNGYAFSNLALVPCKLDLTGSDLNTKTQLVYILWNEYSVQYTGLNQCANCAYTMDLGSLSVLRSQKVFQYNNLHTPVGRFRVEGKANSACTAASVATPLLGVMSLKLVGSGDVIAISGTTNGKETSDFGYIHWNPMESSYQMLYKRRN